MSLLDAYKPKGNQLAPFIKINDTCILKNEQVKQAFWKICNVVELITGADGSVRSARVEVNFKEKDKAILTRSLKYLFPLEIRSQPPQQSQTTNQCAVAQASSQPADMSCIGLDAKQQ